jgi:putative FmdB family regulatory protein
MPVFRYECSKCGLQFDRLTSKVGGEPEVPCLNCNEASKKLISKVSFNYNSTRPQGDTGVHDVDYPVVDKAVGRSAETRWLRFKERRNVEDTARKTYGTEYLGKVHIDEKTDEYYKVPKEKIEYRRDVAKELHEVLSA